MPGLGKYGNEVVELTFEVRARCYHDVLTTDTLYYGRMYLPTSKLEAMHIRRASPSWQYVFSFVSDQKSIPGSAVSFSSIVYLLIDHRPVSTRCRQVFNRVHCEQR